MEWPNTASLSRYEEVFMFSKRIDCGLPLAIVELFARVGSIAGITLLLMLFMGEVCVKRVLYR